MMVRELLHREQPAFRLRAAHDRRGDLAAVERVAPALSDLPQRLRQVPVHQPSHPTGELALGGEDPGRGREPPQLLCERDLAPESGARQKPFLRVADRRLQQLAQRHRPEPF